MLQPGLLRRRMGTKLKFGRASWCASKPCAQGANGVHQRPRALQRRGQQRHAALTNRHDGTHATGAVSLPGKKCQACERCNVR